MTGGRLLCFALTAAAVFGGAASTQPTIYGSAYQGPGGLSTFYSISPASGAATRIGLIGFTQVGAMAFDAQGTLYGIGKTGATWMLITINTTTGAGTAVGPLGQASLTAVSDMDFRPSDGTLFVLGATQNTNDTLYTVSTATGAATYLGSGQSSFSTDGDALAFNSAGVLYNANQQEMDITSQANGSRKFFMNLNYAAAFGTPGPRANSMKFDQNGTLWATVVSGYGPGPNGGANNANNSIGTIDPSTGAVSFVGSTVQGMDGLAVLRPAVKPPTGPQVTGLENNYSYILPGMPNYGIAQGSIFDIFGTGLANAFTPAAGAPLPKTLAGATVNITVNGTTTQAILYFAAPTQIAAILPSATPAGSGQLTVTVGGQTSPPAAITVVPAAFGLLTLNSIGNGPAAVYDINYQYNGFTNAANPGDYLTLWGSGLGPVTGDETMAPVQTNMTTPIEVDIGGVAANVPYHGRSGYAGLDQIDVQVPAGVAGCYVSVVVKTGNIVSNFGTIAVAQTGRVCSEPTTGITANQVQALASKSSFTNSSLQIINGQTTSAIAAFDRFTPFEFSAFEPGPMASLGSCAVYGFSGANQTVTNPVQPTALSAGSALTLSTPTNSGLGTVTLPFQNGLYKVTGLTPTGSEKGTYSFTGTGADIGPFSASVTWPGGGGAFAATLPSIITRSQGVTVTWPQPNASAPGEFIQVSGSSSLGSGNTAVGGEFFCSVPLSVGQFTIPPSVLLSLPATPAGASSSLNVNLVLPGNFSAPNLDFGLLDFFVSTGQNVTYQ